MEKKKRILKLLADASHVDNEFDEAGFMKAMGMSPEQIDECLAPPCSPAQQKGEVELKFVAAAKRGDRREVDRMLASGVDIHSDHDAALLWSASYGHIHVVERLLKAGANVRQEDHLALQWAAEAGHVEIVGRLLDKGADILALFKSTKIKVPVLLTILKCFATNTPRGIEAVMRLKTTPRLKVLKVLYPFLSLRQIHEDISVMTALGLAPSSMAGVWSARHPVGKQMCGEGLSVG